MVTPLVRVRSGTKIMPVTAYGRPTPNYTRRPAPLTGLRGLGQNTALDIANEVAAQPGGSTALVPSTNSYLNSPAFLASQQASEQAECNWDPTSPGCEVSQATGELQTGGPTEAGIAFTAAQYCEQQAFNVTQFGYAPDTVNCVNGGTTPTAAGVTATESQYAISPTATPVSSSVVTGNKSTPVVTANTAISNVLSPPTGQSSVTPQSISNGSPQGGNTNTNVGAGADNASGGNSTTATTACPTGETCTYIPGIPDTYVYIGGAAVVGLILFSMMGKK
jgi:hypothetical protein